MKINIKTTKRLLSKAGLNPNNIEEIKIDLLNPGRAEVIYKDKSDSWNPRETYYIVVGSWEEYIVLYNSYNNDEIAVLEEDEA